MNSEDAKIPVTLLTGFLGAGKTTLLNNLVRDPEAGRVAVIMNEFGDVGLDHDLIEVETEETVLLQSGCICCSVRGDLLKTLGKLVARRIKGSLQFDRVVIETTGIADPGPILHSLIVDELVGPYYRMDGIVTVADAATGPHTLETQFEAAQQVAMADLIVLSKVDLVTPVQLSRFEAQLSSFNASAQRRSALHGAVPVKELLNLSALRSNVSCEEVFDWLGSSAPKPDPLAGLSGFGPKPDTSNHVGVFSGSTHTENGHQIVSASIEVDEPISAGMFDFWLDTLIALKGSDILRIKGIVHVDDIEWPFVFHGVQHIFDAPVPLDNWAGDDKKSRVVVIARNLSTADLTASLETLRLSPQETVNASDGMLGQTTEMPF